MSYTEINPAVKVGITTNGQRRRRRIRNSFLLGACIALIGLATGYLIYMRHDGSDKPTAPTQPSEPITVTPNFGRGGWTELQAFGIRPDTLASVQWGVATASYQIEGAVAEDGRTPSIWDTFSHVPGNTDKGDTGDVAIDFYHRWADDVKLMQGLGIKMFRFSISWTRILPDGACSDPSDMSTCRVNAAGVAFYSNLIDALLAAGIEPQVTLFHWDLPQSLQDRYGGWLGAEVAQDFAAYARVCFDAFGSRVEHWLTLNEPLTFCPLGYSTGYHAPGHKGEWDHFLCGHNALRAHALAVDVYRREGFQAKAPSGKGRVGMAINSDWCEPYDSSSEADIASAKDCMDYSLGWFSDPVYFGDYPAVMHPLQEAGHVPVFTDEEKALLKGSMDYFGLNHYSSRWVQADPLAKGHEKFRRTGFRPAVNATVATTTAVVDIPKAGDVPIGPVADSDWLMVVPWGLGRIVRHIHERYGAPDIYITENGCDAPKEDDMTVDEVVQDSFRVDYYRGYIQAMLMSVQEAGVKIRAYTAWSMFDNYEWADGYAKRFGLTHVDYTTQKRTVKASALWLSSLFKNGRSMPSEQFV